ncbi:hypothetical protein EDB85DRAFT_2141372 [Lactarius pseudohatsudake]|nr:hypothetical protein EDB85DRAFT_2141372 [Lactarius pseudohatsudake]
MSSDPSSESNLRSLFESALREYENLAGTNLLNSSLTIQLQSCDSADDICAVLQEQAQAFHKFRGDDGRLTRWLKQTVHVLHVLSTSSALGEAIGLPFPPAKAIFAGIGILFAACIFSSAIKDVSASYDALVDLFESAENFLRRLDIYTKTPPTTAMTEIIVKILVELLSTLALATQQVKQGRLKKFGMKLFGENETEAVLQRLDRLNHEEARTVAAQTLEVVYGLVRNMKVAVDGGNASMEDIRQELVVMQQMASSINKSQRDQLQNKSRQWLSPTDPSTNYNIAREAYHDGTATWFIQGATFREWEVTGSLFWIYGKPGSGKSILWLCDAGLATMAYFFFDFKDTAKRDARAALSSLLVQLCYQSDPCSDILGRLFSGHHSGTKQPSNDTLMKCLRDMFALPKNGPTYIILDALDECLKSAGTPSPRESVLKLVGWLTKLGYPNLHICVTSRLEADIECNLRPLASHCISLHDESGQQEDINKYIISFMKTDTNTRKWKQDEKDLVINRLTQSANGMFRWVFCQLDSLRRCLPGRIRRALGELPSTLDATYEHTLLDIDEQNWAYAYRLFQCITVASRPLRVEELAEFLAFDFDEGDNPTFDAGWRPEDPNDAVLSTCSSLIAVVNVGDRTIVQFSHFSVKEFLTSNRIDPDELHGGMTPLYYAIGHGNLKFAQLLIKHGADVNAQRALGWRPLLFASIDGRLEILRLLVGSGADVNARDDDWTALYLAAEEGHLEVVRVLLENDADPNVRRWNGTPLYRALVDDHLEVAQLLLKYGADINSPDLSGETLLHLASKSGDKKTAQQLLERGANIHARNGEGKTPLQVVALGGKYQDTVQLLLQYGAENT